MPETLAVKAIVPFAIADKGRPEGEIVTASVSTISTYISLLVCLTFALRHGTGEVDCAVLLGPNRGLGPAPPLPSENGVLEAVNELGVVLGSPTPPSRLFIKDGASTRSRSALGSVQLMMPPSTISFNSWATTS